MNSKLLFCALFLATFSLFAQDKKWSIEANYPITDVDQLNGVLDVGVKYRFADLGIVELGAGLGAALFSDRENYIYDTDIEFDYNWKRILLQPTVFAEFSIPGLAKLKPSAGLGYSYLYDDIDHKQAEVGYNESDSWGAFNANLGLSYDLTNRFFVKVQYDFFNHRQRWLINADVPDSYRYETKWSTMNVFKAGVGFRF